MTTPAALALALAAWVAASSIVTAASFNNATTSSNSASSPFSYTFQVCAGCLQDMRGQGPPLLRDVCCRCFDCKPAMFAVATPSAGRFARRRQTKRPRNWAAQAPGLSVSAPCRSARAHQPGGASKPGRRPRREPAPQGTGARRASSKGHPPEPDAAGPAAVLGRGGRASILAGTAPVVTQRFRASAGNDALTVEMFTKRSAKSEFLSPKRYVGSIFHTRRVGLFEGPR